MKLLGCFKIVPDLEQLTEAQWQLDDRQQIDTRFVRREWDCYSESLLELMLRARDKNGFTTSLEALTVSREVQSGFLKNLYGLGFDKVIWMKEAGMEHNRFMPENTAWRISQYCKEKRPDCVLFGSQSSDEGNGKVPYLVGEQMGWPCISSAIRFEAAGEDSIYVNHIQLGRNMHRRIKLPCILTVGNVPETYLRIPTLKDKLAAAGAKVEEWERKEPDQGRSSWDISMREPKLVGLERKQQGRTALHLKAQQIETLAARLYREHIYERVREN